MGTPEEPTSEELQAILQSRVDEAQLVIKLTKNGGFKLLSSILDRKKAECGKEILEDLALKRETSDELVNTISSIRFFREFVESILTDGNQAAQYLTEYNEIKE